MRRNLTSHCARSEHKFGELGTLFDGVNDGFGGLHIDFNWRFEENLGFTATAIATAIATTTLTVNISEKIKSYSFYETHGDCHFAL